MPRLLLNSARGLLSKYSHLLGTLWVSPGSITRVTSTWWTRYAPATWSARARS